MHLLLDSFARIYTQRKKNNTYIYWLGCPKYKLWEPTGNCAPVVPTEPAFKVSLLAILSTKLEPGLIPSLGSGDFLGMPVTLLVPGTQVRPGIPEH